MNIVKLKGNGLGPSVYTYNSGWISNVKNKKEHQYCKIKFDGSVIYHDGKVYCGPDRIIVNNSPTLPLGYLTHDGEYSEIRDGCVNPNQPQDTNYEYLITKQDSLLFRYFGCKKGEIPIIFGNEKDNKNTLICVPSGIFREYLTWKDTVNVTFSFDKQTVLVHQVLNSQVLILDNPVYE